jgi:hypothetical protein
MAWRLGAVKSKSNKQVFLPPSANIAAKFTESRVFPVPPLYEWNAKINVSSLRQYYLDQVLRVDGH